LPDVYVTCDVCRGGRYNRETLAVKYKGLSIADLLDTTIEDAVAVLENIPQINQKLQTLLDVGLGYIKLGQSATTLKRRRGAADQACQGIIETRHRQNDLYPRRTDHRATFRRRS